LDLFKKCPAVIVYIAFIDWRPINEGHLQASSGIKAQHVEIYLAREISCQLCLTDFAWKFHPTVFLTPQIFIAEVGFYNYKFFILLLFYSATWLIASSFHLPRLFAQG
jgi:hypothetical protein